MGSINTKAKNLYKVIEENYITKVGGTLTKTAEEINIFTTEEGINMYSNTSIDMKAEEQTVLGEYQEPPEPREEEAIGFDCVVEVYRSLKQRQDVLGKSDTLYKGAFGFDRYKESTCGKGYRATNSYEKKVLKGQRYYVPWLSFWPPKSDLSIIPEITKNTNFTPPTSCTLYFKINEGNDAKKNNGDLIFVSSDKNLQISGTNKHTLTGKAVNDEFTLNVSCTGVIKKDAYVNIHETSETGKIVGKIKIIANNNIGISKVHFVPIEYELTTTSERKRQKATKKTAEFNTLVDNVLQYLNTQAFNQSLIFLSATKEKNVITVPKKVISTENESAYSSSVSKAYFDGIPDQAVPQSNNKEEVKALDKAIRKYFKPIRKKHSKLKENGLYCYDTMNSIDPALKQNYDTAYGAYLATLGGETLINGHKKEEDTIYVFVHKDLETLNVSGFKYSGYAYHGGSNAYVFNKPLKNKNYGVFAHEIAHVMGLDHTFELTAKHLNKKLNKALKELEKDLEKKKENTGTALNSNNSIANAQKGFENGIKDINYLISNQKRLFYKDEKIENEKGYYGYINKKILDLNQAASLEFNFKGLTSTLSPLTAIEKSIKANKLKQKENSKKVIGVSQSYTQENFMDYDSLEADSTSNTGIPKEIEYNENFYYKSFWKWQWDKMNASKFINRKQL